MKALVLLLSILVTETPGPHMMHAGTVSKAFKTHEECVAAIPLTGGTCSAVTNVVKVGTCEDEKPPDIKIETNAEGQLVLPAWTVQVLPNGNWGPPMIMAYVKASWVYPDCWKQGFAPFTEWDSNGKYEGPGVDEPTGRTP